MKSRMTARYPTPKQPTPIRELLDGPALLTRLWPDQHPRPSLRWLRAQQKLGVIPVVRCGRRALFCPSQVLDAIRQRFTVMPRASVRDGYSVWDLPILGTLTDGDGLLVWLNKEFGLQRSLRWLRDQQKARTLPFIKMGARVFFSMEQVQSVLENSGGRRSGRGPLIRQSDQHRQTGFGQSRTIRLLLSRYPWMQRSNVVVHIASDLSFWTSADGADSS
jgi:hypothetical protein